MHGTSKTLSGAEKLGHMENEAFRELSSAPRLATLGVSAYPTPCWSLVFDIPSNASWMESRAVGLEIPPVSGPRHARSNQN